MVRSDDAQIIVIKNETKERMMNTDYITSTGAGRPLFKKRLDFGLTQNVQYLCIRGAILRLGA